MKPKESLGNLTYVTQFMTVKQLEANISVIGVSID